MARLVSVYKGMVMHLLSARVRPWTARNLASSARKCLRRTAAAAQRTYSCLSPPATEMHAIQDGKQRAAEVSTGAPASVEEARAEKKRGEASVLRPDSRW